MKILSAVDGSIYTAKAVDFLIARFNWFKELPELHVLYVQEPIPEGRAKAVLGTAAVENYYREGAEAILLPHQELLRSKGISFKAGYVVGEVAEQIHAYTERHQIDMVVMGAHGHGALKNLIMGSVATKVIARSSVPVLLIR
ncbi:universal stress protein [Herbaspirillum sp. GCM10030257]|uniref:universal stress protein n=1 Tax=Herbaspirillum sp. GCM10030257 TaxID=3273393 RepID=UPI00360EBCAD